MLNSTVRNILVIFGLLILISVIAMASEHFDSIKEFVVLQYRAINKH